MNFSLSHPSDRSTCPDRLVCRCLKVTEEVLLAAVQTFELRTVKEVRRHTGAGDGCTACHRAIRQYLERHHQEEARSASSAACCGGHDADPAREPAHVPV